MTCLKLPHKVLDYACPINGLEDLYEWKTGNRLPGYFLMDLSMTGFLFLRQKNAPTPRMVFWGNGTGRPQHEFLADVIGYSWTSMEGRSFSTSWKAAIQSIERGSPVILGLLDMFHLPYYPHFYHRVHIPQHYVLLVGYDQGSSIAYVQDNGLSEIQAIPLEDLQKAWNVNNPGQGKKNTLFILEFNDRIAPLEEIVVHGLRKKANLILHPPVGFMGISGMRKLAADIAHWPQELSKDQIKKCLIDLVTFTCSVVPMLPQRLLPYRLKFTDPHHAVRDRFSEEIGSFVNSISIPGSKEAAELLAESGRSIGRLTDVITDQILADSVHFEEPAKIIREIADLEEKAYELLILN